MYRHIKELGYLKHKYIYLSINSNNEIYIMIYTS